MDDEEDVLESMGAALTGLPVNIARARDGAEAIAELRKGGVSLVVLDLNLPGISGLRVLEWMSGQASDTPVLVVTGLDKVPPVLARFPNLVRIVEKKPVSNELLRHLVATYAGVEG